MQSSFWACIRHPLIAHLVQTSPPARICTNTAIPLMFAGTSILLKRTRHTFASAGSMIHSLFPVFLGALRMVADSSKVFRQQNHPRLWQRGHTDFRRAPSMLLVLGSIICIPHVSVRKVTPWASLINLEFREFHRLPKMAACRKFLSVGWQISAVMTFYLQMKSARHCKLRMTSRKFTEITASKSELSTRMCISTHCSLHTHAASLTLPAIMPESPARAAIRQLEHNFC